MRPSLKLLTVFLASTMAVRCATATNGRYEKIHVTSDPPGASVRVDCGKANRRAPAPTPTVIAIPRNADRCSVLLVKDGYERRSVTLDRVVSEKAIRNFYGAALGVEAMIEAWDDDLFAIAFVFTLAGAALGGVGLGVDRATGALFEHSPGFIDVDLVSDLEAEDTDRQ